jgi:beta-galactosidase
MILKERRAFLTQVSGAGMAVSLLGTGYSALQASTPGVEGSGEGIIALGGEWQFRLDPNKAGDSSNYGIHPPTDGWRKVQVPHTWQVEQSSANYLGVAWYLKEFSLPPEWQQNHVRIEFEAIFHSAVVWCNGRKIGEHAGKGYTVFTCDLTEVLRQESPNQLVVRVDNSFFDAMLPRNNSYDWTPDGGIYRPVNLLATPPVFIERLAVDSLPELSSSKADLHITAVVQNSTRQPASFSLRCQVVDEATGQVVLTHKIQETLHLAASEKRGCNFPHILMEGVKLWHFDHPHLYRLDVTLVSDRKTLHTSHTAFGVRKIEVREGAFFFNGERVWLMGVERMAGSHPDYGMAEPAEWIEHDHRDMKELNCIFTRVHWQQDRRILDYCDRHGILIQVEVPTWGGDTFKGMDTEPSAPILQNGLEQLREMVARDRNHPSVFSWGLCNEINGQNPPAAGFARRLFEEARRLDPHRLLSYASNTLQSTPEKDISSLMDFIEWNEYYESWYGGDVESVRRNLQEIHRAFPGKPIVISEYGYCECAPDRVPGDSHRVRVLKTHDMAYRECEFVAGAIFFCYNDYRTHIGDKGRGVMKQRVHGVVDLYGNRKPSFEVLREESSPVEQLELIKTAEGVMIRLAIRRQLPAYSLEGYSLHCIVNSYENLPMEKLIVELPRLEPGARWETRLIPQETKPLSIRVEVMRPTGFSARTAHWKA